VSQPVEVVERKGLGHPDTICDGIAEHVCVCLCRYYLAHFGCILHHNVDKILLCGGAARAAFGGGVVVEPIEIYLGGRATAEYRGSRIPIHEIAIAACRDWLREHLPALDSDEHVRLYSRLRPGSADLTSVFARGGPIALANDTSCGAGCAPRTDLEQVVLAVEHALNSRDTKREHPAIGEDIKVMGVRHDRQIQLTIGCAFVGRHLADLAHYSQEKDAARALAIAAARSTTTLDVQACVNAADDLARGDVFLTVTGTCAEAGDDGQVGRGNRVGGLITPYRAMTLEAAAGKNPVSHVGKIYNLVAGRIATRVSRELPLCQDVSCVLVSAIGRPVNDPQIVDIGLVREQGGAEASVSATVHEIVRSTLDEIGDLRDGVLSEKLTLF